MKIEEIKTMLRQHRLEDLEAMLSDVCSHDDYSGDRREYLAALLQVIKEKRELLQRIMPM
jgi:hypothetical protein